METIYEVYGHTGEYEDHYIWSFAAYPSRQEAEDVRDKLNAKLMTLGLHVDAPFGNLDDSGPMKEVDNRFACDGGSEYHLLEIPWKRRITP